jgi:hypothetical protein
LQAWRWVVAGFFLAVAPLPPAGAWLLYSGQGPTPMSLVITVAAGAAAVLSFVAGVGAVHEARAAGTAARTRPGGRPAGNRPTRPSRPPRLPRPSRPPRTRGARHRQDGDRLAVLRRDDVRGAS